MDVNEFEIIATALLRTTVGWQTKIARRLGYEPRTIRRWLHQGEIPDHAAQKLRDMARVSDLAGHWPRGEWMVGMDEAGRRLVHHLQPPRFTARIVYCAPDGPPCAHEEPANVLSGTVYVIQHGDDNQGEVVLCEIGWIDEPRSGGVVQLLRAASNAVEQFLSSDAID